MLNAYTTGRDSGGNEITTVFRDKNLSAHFSIEVLALINFMK
jgi:hypothetical protein